MPFHVAVRPLRAALACALALVAPAAGAAPETPAAALPFGVPGHGRLLLAVPEGWRAGAKPIQEPAGLALRFGPASGADFSVLVTVMVPPGGALATERLRAAARRTAEELAPGAAEKEIPVEELSGPSARLAFASSTDRKWADRAPPQGEWRHVTQGAAAVGDLLASFTILGDGKGAPARARALEMLRGARPLPPGEGPSAIRLTAGGRSIGATLPGLEVLKVDALPGGAGALVMGTLPGDFAATLTVQEAPEGQGRASDVREARWANGAAKTAAEKTEVRLSTRDGMEVVSYLIPRAEGVEIRQRHVHGYLAGGGAIAEVHLSKMRYVAGDDAALDRMLASVKLDPP